MKKSGLHHLLKNVLTTDTRGVHGGVLKGLLKNFKKSLLKLFYFFFNKTFNKGVHSGVKNPSLCKSVTRLAFQEAVHCCMS